MHRRPTGGPATSVTVVAMLTTVSLRRAAGVAHRPLRGIPAPTMREAESHGWGRDRAQGAAARALASIVASSRRPSGRGG
jgi:hypothetical protein